MPVSKLAWMICWVSFFLTASQGFLKLPNSTSPNTSSTVDQPEPQTPFVDKQWTFERHLDNTQKFPEQIAMAKIGSENQNPLCRIISDSVEKPPELVEQYQRQSASVALISQNSEVNLNLPQRIFAVVQRLFRWTEITQPQYTVKKSPTGVIVAKARKSALSLPNHRAELLKSYQVKQGFFDFTPNLQEISDDHAEWQEQEEWTVWIKGHLIAKIPDQQEAEIMARRLKHLINEPDFDPWQIKPTMEEGKPAAKMGDRLLFVIDLSLISPDSLNPDLLAIEWVNNLRVAFKAAPLELIEAQQQMYNIAETATSMEGLASWYGPYFHGRYTANGEIYDQYALTAAHPSIPLNTYLKITNLNNFNSVIIRLNDRGPYIPPRTLDLSLGAASCLNSVEKGVIPYRAVIMERVPVVSVNSNQ